MQWYVNRYSRPQKLHTNKLDENIAIHRRSQVSQSKTYYSIACSTGSSPSNLHKSLLPIDRYISLKHNHVKHRKHESCKSRAHCAANMSHVKAAHVALLSNLTSHLRGFVISLVVGAPSNMLGMTP